jgi:hypothetical protein
MFDAPLQHHQPPTPPKLISLFRLSCSSTLSSFLTWCILDPNKSWTNSLNFLSNRHECEWYGTTATNETRGTGCIGVNSTANDVILLGKSSRSSGSGEFDCSIELFSFLLCIMAFDISFALMSPTCFLLACFWFSVFVVLQRQQ